MKTDWRWSEDYGCYIHQDTIFNPPVAFCLGERHVHIAPGIDTHCANYVGSTVDNWHGWHFGIDLKQAVQWVISETKTDGHEYWNPFSLKVEGVR